jgi:putative cell wall-binding protein
VVARSVTIRLQKIVLAVVTVSALALALSAPVGQAAGAFPVAFVHWQNLSDPFDYGLSVAPDSLQNVFVLGGEAAVAGSVIAEAGRVTSKAPLRIAGVNRYATAVEVTRRAFPSGAEVVYIATGLAFADALTVAPALQGGTAALLLTRPDQLPQLVADELIRLAPEQTYLLGGPAAISAPVAAEVQRLVGHTPRRIAGSNRYETAVDISQHTFPAGARTVYVASGETFADALAAAPALADRDSALLLTSRNGLPAVVADELLRLSPGQIHVLGGISAVSEQVEIDIRSVTGLTPNRIAGSNRYETAQRINHYIQLNLVPSPQGSSTAVIATGADFPDALAASQLLVAKSAQLVLTEPRRIPQSTGQELIRLVDPQNFYPATSQVTVSVSPDPASAGSLISVTWRVIDFTGIESDEFGVAATNFGIRPPERDFIPCGGNYTPRISGNRFDGVYQGTCLLPADAVAGTWIVSIGVRENYRSTTYHTQAGTFEVS